MKFVMYVVSREENFISIYNNRAVKLILDASCRQSFSCNDMEKDIRGCVLNIKLYEKRFHYNALLRQYEVES